MRLRRWLSLFLAVLVTCASVPPARAVTLKPEVQVQVPPLTLQDITEGTIPNRLGAITLGRIPEPGRGRFISRAYVVMRARSQHRPVPSFEGETVRSHVQRPSRSLPISELIEPIRRLLRKQLTSGEQVKIFIEETPENVRVLPGSYRLKLPSRGPYDRRRGTTWFHVQIHQKGIQTARFRVKARIQQYAKVPVTTRPVRRGHVLTEEDVSWVKREISRTSGGLIQDSDGLLGLRTRRSFRPGEIILAGMLERPVLIDRRDPVTILYKTGSIRVKTRGLAMEDGARGDEIDVINRSSETRVTAEVLDERTVLVTDA